MANDNIKSHKKAGLHPIIRKGSSSGSSWLPQRFQSWLFIRKETTKIYDDNMQKHR